MRQKIPVRATLRPRLCSFLVLRACLRPEPADQRERDGAPPQTTAQGVKIEPMKVIVAAIAARKGQIDGSAKLPARSGVASVTV